MSWDGLGRLPTSTGWQPVLPGIRPDHAGNSSVACFLQWERSLRRPEPVKPIYIFTSIASATIATIMSAQQPTTQPAPTMSDKIEKLDAKWKKILTPEQYHVLREKGTERAGTGEYADNHDTGIYKCAACAKELFSSETKFESGTG